MVGGDLFDLLRFEQGRFDDSYGAVVRNNEPVPLVGDDFTIEVDDEITGHIYDNFGARYQVFYRAILQPAAGGEDQKDSAVMIQERTACP